MLAARVKIAALAGAVTMLGLGAVNSPAHAVEEDPIAKGTAIVEAVINSPNMEQALAALSPEDRQIFTDFTTVATVETKQTDRVRVPSGRDTCWGWSMWREAKSTVQLTLFKYGNTVRECHFAGTTRSVSITDSWDSVHFAGWRIEKDHTKKTLNAGWEGRGVTQHFFVFGGGGVDVQHPSPCLQQRLNANGVSKANSQSCSLG